MAEARTLLRKGRHQMPTLTLEQAAKFLHMHPQTLRDRAKGGKIPGAAKPGKSWVFIQEDLEAYVRLLSPYRSREADARYAPVRLKEILDQALRRSKEGHGTRQELAVGQRRRR